MIKYQIMQIDDIENCDYAFRGYKEAKFNLEDYSVVYEGEIDEVGSEYIDLCEQLFEIFNIAWPEDFKGHSLSVSDVVVFIPAENKKVMYYCDHIGWVKIK